MGSPIQKMIYRWRVFLPGSSFGYSNRGVCNIYSDYVYVHTNTGRLMDIVMKVQWWREYVFTVLLCWIEPMFRTISYNHCLVGVFNPSEKYESQLGWWHSQYMESHKIPWFQTTSQLLDCQEWVEFIAGFRDQSWLMRTALLGRYLHKWLTLG
jgi:hypothetical protein